MTLAVPNGATQTLKPGEWTEISDPQLWWPHGYGAQPLYTVQVTLLAENQVLDTWQKRIGLHTMTVLQQED